MDKISVIRAAAYNIGDIVGVGTSSAATGTSVDVPAFVFPETAQIQGYYLYARSIGTIPWNSQQRIISDFIAANTRCVVGQSLSPYPTQADVTVFRNFSMDEYKNAFDQALDMAKLHHLQDYVATLGLNGSQYEYAVPSGLISVVSLRLIPSGPLSDYEADDLVDRVFNLDGWWQIERNPVGSMCIVFDPRHINMGNVEESWVRVIGQVRPDVAATDVGSVSAEIHPFLIAEMSKTMAARKMTGKENDRYQKLYGAWGREASDLENFIHRPFRGVAVT